MTERMSFETLINLILIVVVLAIVIVGFIYFDIGGKISDLFPTFGKQEGTVAWNGKYFLEHPDLIVYEITDEYGELHLWYDTSVIQQGEKKGQAIGWRWFIDNSRPKEGWQSVENYAFVARELRPAFDRDKNLIKDLAAVKKPEAGLQKIVQRIVKSKEQLIVTIGEDWSETYAFSDARLRDVDGLIDKFNQISRGVVREQE